MGKGLNEMSRMHTANMNGCGGVVGDGIKKRVKRPPLQPLHGPAWFR